MRDEIVPIADRNLKPSELNRKYEFLDPAKMKAVYALNMCTVSVSQILDYNDIYVLEQEYDAILNNLNLEVMPKDEALRNILTELLNVITFFRIQEAKKAQVEKKYQRRIKDAIWSAIPNLSVITPVSVGSIGKDTVNTLLKTNAVGVVASIVTQVGTGYMNYRREKANAKRDKENEDFELQITAIEQFSALQRELFTTAWKLADKYGYPDELRLTERQIKQYNQILMDPDDYRRCARLEAIQGNFIAYPPFWYMLAHTELLIAQNDDDKTVRKAYREKAEECLSWYCATFCFASKTGSDKQHFGILREDQMAASAFLEYADLLLSNEISDDAKIYSLICAAESKAGQANDILQLCAVAYLNIKRMADAGRLLKTLVNEGYNAVSNARLLSWIYAYECNTEDPNFNTDYINADYELLCRSVHKDCLFPMPSKDKNSENGFIESFKKNLIAAYRMALTQYEGNMKRRFAIVPRYTPLSDSALADCYVQLKTDSIALNALSALNQTVATLDELTIFTELQNRSDIIYSVTGKLKDRKAKLDDLKKKDQDGFSAEEYSQLASAFSYEALANSLFVSAKDHIMKAINGTETSKALQQLTIYENDLVEFCKRNHLDSPAYLLLLQQTDSTGIAQQREYFDESLLDVSRDTHEIREKMKEAIQTSRAQLIKDAQKVNVLLQGEADFNTYFENAELKGEKSVAKSRAIAVIDDKTKKDYDLLLCEDGIMVVSKNEIEPGTVKYNSVFYKNGKGKSALMVYYPVEYKNDGVNIEQLHALIKNLSTLISAAN